MKKLMFAMILAGALPAFAEAEKETVKREVASQSDFTQDYLEQIADERAHEETLKAQREAEFRRYERKTNRTGGGYH